MNGSSLTQITIDFFDWPPINLYKLSNIAFAKFAISKTQKIQTTMLPKYISTPFYNFFTVIMQLLNTGRV